MAKDDEGQVGQDGQVGQEGTPALSRRDLLKRAGLVVGAAVVVPAISATAQAPASAAQETPKTLTRLEYDTLDAICARIIPTDANGPGAREARAVRFIDWGLTGALASARDQYAAGLAAVEAHAVAAKAGSFAKLSPADQDAVVDDLSQNRILQAPQGFFNTVRLHTIQGTFSDPFYGGNVNYVGWDLIGYPGVRIAVPAEYQEWNTALKPNHQSAYDSEMFSKGTI